MRSALILVVSTFILAACSFVSHRDERSPASLAYGEMHSRSTVGFIDDPQMALRVRWDLLEQEDQEIFAHFHLWDGTGVGRYSLVKLCQKAQSGVKVRLVVDGLSMLWTSVFTDAALIQVLNTNCASASGQRLEIRFWNPVDTRKLTTFLRDRNLRRNHDKVLYLGAQNLVYEGDRNWQNVNYRMDPKKPGYTYRSSDAVVGGPVVQDVKEYLEAIWQTSVPAEPQMVTREQTAYRTNVGPRRDEVRHRTLRYDEYYEADYREALADFTSNLSEIRSVAPSVVSSSTPDPWRREMKSVDRVRFVHYEPSQRLNGGPNGTVDDSMNVELLDLLKSAKSEVVISTPFLRTPQRYYDVIRDLRAAGVKVTLITCPARSRLIPQFFRFQNRDINRLRRLGVEIFQSSGEDDLHTKAIIVDRQYVYLGTHNFNMRSTYLDLESGFIFDDRRVAETVNDFLFAESMPYEKKSGLAHILLKPIMSPLMRWPYLAKQF